MLLKHWNTADFTDDVDATTVQTADNDIDIYDAHSDGRADTDTLRAEQRADPSLQLWYKLATEKKGNSFFKKGLFFSPRASART